MSQQGTATVNLATLERNGRNVKRMRELHTAAVNQNRNLTAEEQAEFDRLEADCVSIRAQIETKRKVEGWEKEVAKPFRPVPGQSLERGLREDGCGVPTTCATSSELRAVSRSDSYAEAAGLGPTRLSVGRLIRGIATGRWDGGHEERALMYEGSDTTGGFLLNPQMSASVIDKARNKSVVIAAGAQTVPMTTSELKIARVATDPTAYWVREAKPITASENTFELLTMRARTLAALVPISIELMEDAPNAASIIENSIAQAIALEFDRAALRGSGAGEEPVGIRYAGDVNETTGVGVPDYEDISNAVQTIAQANGTANAVVMSPREAGTFDRICDGEGNPLTPPASWQALQKHVTNQIPITLGSGADSEIYVGDFTQLLLGVRNEVRLELFRSGGSAAGLDAVSEKLVLVRAMFRGDIALMRETHFVRLLGVTAT